MKIDGQNRIAAPVEAVWEALNDPAILKAAIPGCEALEKLSDTEFKATVITKVGPIKAKFNGQVELADLDPPNSYTLSGRGAGGVAGNAKGSAAVQLRPDGEGTLLTYDIDAEVTGKLAQLGQRLIMSTTKMLAGKFFDKFEQLIGGEGAEEEEPEAASPSEDVPLQETVDEAPGTAPPAMEAEAEPKQSPASPARRAEPRIPPVIRFALAAGGAALAVLILIWTLG